MQSMLCPGLYFFFICRARLSVYKLDNCRVATPLLERVCFWQEKNETKQNQQNNNNIKKQNITNKPKKQQQTNKKQKQTTSLQPYKIRCCP